MTRRIHPRRIFSRCQVELPVRFWSLGSDGDMPVEYMKGEAIDLSEGGLLFRSDCFENGFLQCLVDDDSLFAIRIHLRGQSDWVRATAKVVWIEKENNKLLVRACFVDIDDESADLVQDLVARGTYESQTLS